MSHNVIICYEKKTSQKHFEKTNTFATITTYITEHEKNKIVLKVSDNPSLGRVCANES